VKKYNLHWLFYQLLIIAVLFLILFLTQSYTADIIDTFEPVALLTMMTSFTIIFAFIVLLDLAYSHWERRKGAARVDIQFSVIQKSISKLEIEIKDLIDATTKMGPIKSFLVSVQTYLREEATIENGEVWIYTPELTLDITAEFVKVISTNVSKGIKYHYCLPDVPDLHGDFKILINSIRKVNDMNLNQVYDYVSVCWLPPALSRPGGITVHVHTVMPGSIAGFTTLPYERWGNDFFIRMDEIYTARAHHYLQELNADYRTEVQK